MGLSVKKENVYVRMNDTMFTIMLATFCIFLVLSYMTYKFDKFKRETRSILEGITKSIGILNEEKEE